jgi:hypothetical protein
MFVTAVSFGIILFANEPIDAYGPIVFMLLGIAACGLLNLIHTFKLASLVENKYPLLFEKHKTEGIFGNAGLNPICFFTDKADFENLADEEITNSLQFIKKNDSFHLPFGDNSHFHANMFDKF